MVSVLKTDAQKLLDAEEIIRRKNAELTNNKQEIARIHRENDTAESIRREIWKLAEHTPEPPKWLSGKGIRGGERGCPVLMLSDIHYGEVINSDEVGGVNAYNSKIAAQRLKNFTDASLDISFNHMGRANVAYPGLVLALGGDMISGSIHEELEISNDKTPHQAVNELTDLLAGVIDGLAAKFGRLFIPAICGNHGRSTHRVRFKGHTFTNFDWNIYCNLERHFRKEKHVQFMIPNETDARFNVFGTRFLFTHGDLLGTRGGDGIIGILGPLARGRLKVGQSEAAIGRDFDMLLIGHYHQVLFLPTVICNGAVKGYDEYARLSLRVPYAPPAQVLFFVHPEYGITARWPIFLEPKQSASQNKVWVSWEK